MSASTSIENQLNTFILASMVETFMDLHMVILDAPPYFDSFESSSQVNCIKADKKAPTGLPYLVEPSK